MLISAIFSLLLAGLVYSNPAPQGNFTLLESRVLADGSATLHRIQEHGGDLPELPSLPEEDHELEEGVIVPLDANGNILPEFKHLVEPQVIEMSREQIQRLNYSMASVDAVIVPAVEPLSNVVPQVTQEEEREVEAAGADYDEAAVPDSRLPLPKDYENSKEQDPEVETGDDGLREDELEKIEQEIQDRNGLEDLVANEVLEDISAITKEAKEELKEEIKQEVETEKAAEEILEVISEDIVKEEVVSVKEERKTNDTRLVESPKIDVDPVQEKNLVVVPVVPVKVETLLKETTEKVEEIPNEEKVVGESEEEEEESSDNRVEKIKGAAEGAYVLEKDKSSEVEEPEEKSELEENHRPSRPLRGDVLFRKPVPDSSFVILPSSALFALSLFCLW